MTTVGVAKVDGVSPWVPRARLVVLAVLLLATIAGAMALSFVCDDAYITFRYVANAHDGLGLVWNPPPFLPVEGYTGFLWALLLWATWGIFGVEPPDSANVLSIGCGVAQFVLFACAAFRLRGKDGNRVGDAISLVTLACIVGNRTFLQWLTSGLETALFNLAVLGWVLLAFRPQERRDTRWLVWWSTTAAIAALTRPDGLLFVAATATVALLSLPRAGRRASALVIGLLPLLATVAHVLWRRWFYGDWLPNTYYAKVLAPWPEMGILYLKCFLFEHGLWLWFPVAFVWALMDTWRLRRDLFAASMRRVTALTALGALVFHAGYYVLKVGGDHFEYRVLSHLVPLAWLSLAAMFAQLIGRKAVVLAMLALTFVFSTPGWVHLAASRDMTVTGVNLLASKVPAFLRPIWRWHDIRQMLLHIHFVCMRSNQHRMTIERFLKQYPERGRFAPDDDIPVVTEDSVGLAGWVMRDCAVIDTMGLNDWVVARTPGIDWETEPGAVHFRKVLRATDADGDGWWDRGEMRRWFAAFFPSPEQQAHADEVIDMVFDVFASERSDAMTSAETESFAQHLFSRGLMAHERTPPKGYVEALEPNVKVVDRRIVVTPRAVPLKSRIPAIEAEWREKIRRGCVTR